MAQTQSISLPKPPRGFTAPWLLGFIVVVAWFGYFAPRALAAHGGVPAMSLAFRVHLLWASSNSSTRSAAIYISRLLKRQSATRRSDCSTSTANP